MPEFGYEHIKSELGYYNARNDCWVADKKKATKYYLSAKSTTLSLLYLIACKHKVPVWVVGPYIERVEPFSFLNW